MGVYRPFGCRGLLKEKKKKAQIKNLGTPPLPNFKILGGALPQTQDLIDACWLYGQILAILCQVSDDGVERPVQYASRCLTDTEKRYGITDNCKEALAVVFGANKFRHFIASSPVVVCTDHSALKSLKTKIVFPSDRLARYALALSDLDLHIVHCPGRVLNLPDALSRIEVEDDAELADQMPNDVTDDHMERAIQRAGLPTEGSADSKKVFRKLICHPRCDIESDSDYDSNDLEDERHPGRRFSPQHTR